MNHAEYLNMAIQALERGLRLLTAAAGEETRIHGSADRELLRAIDEVEQALDRIKREK